jgi:hypothetical protein
MEMKKKYKKFSFSVAMLETREKIELRANVLLENWNFRLLFHFDGDLGWRTKN